MNPLEMVVIIVAIVMVASIFKTRYRSMNGIVADEDGNERMATPDVETMKLRDDVKVLKERIAVLERLATEEHGPRALDREIERLR